ncbi:MAG TPA: hypothetical protein VEY88_09300 [Archangium sp.]|jgi:hypothetical protein|nr:hypothetical protein [Archangium sp.]
MKKALRIGVPAFLLSGLMAAAFAVSAQEPVAQPSTEAACVADASAANGCYPPSEGCIRVDYCTWLCP